ncbi:HAMP domain-containing sensor histidine kinase [Fulvivirgaceae bacterium BMA10]|uniref:histidine kinase n=1 Tax=Splendidivirga corallicola TaxID=3051826 RepID=A0ABT8KKR5_9BACT|nr:HAMP domain-containing sensor histidine kinase [Fulvivirgaceae bacterium BMA10]
MTTVTNELRIKNREIRKVKGELDRFVYSCYHDLGQPIATLSGLVQIVELENKFDSRYLQLMRTTIGKLEDRIKKIIDYSKNANLQIDIQEVNMEKMIHDALESSSAMPMGRMVRQEVEINQQTPIFSDKKRLEIIMHNLISNAYNFHNPREKEPFVKINVKVTRAFITFTVEDNGVGIEERFHKTIFEMFFKGSDNSEGAGLGLYIVKETLSKLKGSIAVNSRIGFGTCFRVKIPNNRIVMLDD